MDLLTSQGSSKGTGFYSLKWGPLCSFLFHLQLISPRCGRINLFLSTLHIMECTLCTRNSKKILGILQFPVNNFTQSKKPFAYLPPPLFSKCRHVPSGDLPQLPARWSSEEPWSEETWLRPAGGRRCLGCCPVHTRQWARSLLRARAWAADSSPG